jgi:hypothetical protein
VRATIALTIFGLFLAPGLAAAQAPAATAPSNPSSTMSPPARDASGAPCDDGNEQAGGDHIDQP